MPPRSTPYPVYTTGNLIVEESRTRENLIYSRVSFEGRQRTFVIEIRQ